MLITVCDICKIQLGNVAPTQLQLCDRCLPYAKEYYEKQAQVATEAAERMKHSLEKFRNEFLRTRVLENNKLKVVPNAG